MKFDIVRAWKDEAYRRTLSAQQLDTLPANPAGELNDTDLAAVYGGGYPGHGYASGSAAASRKKHINTFSGFCEFSFASMSIPILSFPHLLSSVKRMPQVCGRTN